jgi:hypothetical protein
VLLVLIGRLPIWLKVTKINYTGKNRDIVWVNLLVNAKCTAHENYCEATYEQKSKTLWFYSLHEVHIFVIVAMTRNQRQHTTVVFHCLAPFTHPVCVRWAQKPVQRFWGSKTDTRHYTSHTGLCLVSVRSIKHFFLFYRRLALVLVSSHLHALSKKIQKKL